MSVAMATYNGERYLNAQLESIAMQGFQPFELVINDDNSSDETAQVVRNFAVTAAFPVRLEINAERVGSTRNFEKAIARCTGSHVVFADQDDIWLPNKLETIAAIFAENPATGMVFSDAEVFGVTNASNCASLWNAFGLPANLSDAMRGIAGRKIILNRALVTGATMAVSRDAAMLSMPFPKTASGWIHDRWISVLTSMAFPVVAIATPLIRYRQHDRQQVGVPKRTSPSIEFTALRGLLEKSLADQKVVEDRLAERGVSVSPDISKFLEGRRRHLEFRLSVASRRSPSFLRIARELLTGRYHAYSSGARSALKDLVLA